jgi:hypothetical protein
MPGISQDVYVEEFDQLKGQSYLPRSPLIPRKNCHFTEDHSWTARYTPATVLRLCFAPSPSELADYSCKSAAAAYPAMPNISTHIHAWVRSAEQAYTIPRGLANWCRTY